jgi:hypothetical protein
LRPVIHPDGSFEFHYGNCVNTGTNDRIVSGYSKGDDTNFETVTSDNLSDLSGTSARYNPPVSPEGIGLSEAGLLTLDDPDAEAIFDVRVRVADERLFMAEKEFQLSSGLLVTASLPGPSGTAHFGESLPVDLQVKNTGQSAIADLQLVLHCSDTLVSITDSNGTLLNLGPGLTGDLPGAFAFSLENFCKDGTLIFFIIEATAGTSHWQYTFPVTVSAPDLRMTNSILEDGANKLLDPGEIADLVVEIGNFGTREADSLLVTVLPADTTVALLSSSSLDFGQLLPNGSVRVTLRLQAMRYVQPGSATQIMLDITAATGIEKQFVINLQIGSKPVALVSLTSYTSSVQAMKNALDTLGASYDHYTWLGSQLLAYPSIFLILGTTTGSHFLDDNEGSFFASYLRSGGKMYMESYADWAHNRTEVSPMFHFTSQKVPVYTYLEMTGSPGTFCEGMDFSYTGAAYYSIYDLLPADPGFAIAENTDTPPHVLQLAYDGEDYKTIGSMVEFGKLADGAYPSTKTELMEKYLDFFGLVYKGPYPFFHADPATVCRFHPVQLTDDSYDNIVSWHWEMPGGEPSSSDLQNPTVFYPAEGKYDVSLTVSDGSLSHTLTRKDFIRVEVCAGQEEASPFAGLLVFPNPARDAINIRFPEEVKDPVKMVLYDVAGKSIMADVLVPAEMLKTCSFSTAGIQDGFYFLRFFCGKDAITKKLVISR